MIQTEPKSSFTLKNNHPELIYNRKFNIQPKTRLIHIQIPNSKFKTKPKTQSKSPKASQSLKSQNNPQHQ